MKKLTKQKKLANFIQKHLNSCEGYEREETHPTWKNKDIYDISNSYTKIAKDILEFLEKNKK